MRNQLIKVKLRVIKLRVKFPSPPVISILSSYLSYGNDKLIDTKMLKVILTFKILTFNFEILTFNKIILTQK